MMLMTEGGIMAEADARVFGMLMSANRTARRLMAADRTVAGAYARVATLRRMQEAKASRDYAHADRELARELAASIAPGWGRVFVVKMPTSPAGTLPPKARSVRATARASTATRAIRAYAAPLRDSRGRIAVYMNVKYRSFKSKGWRPGLSADHIDYILREAALELAEAQLGRPISNMGESVEEIMACWRGLEEVEAGYRANAKVQYRIVWNLPHELDAEQRRALVEQFCERTFGRLGLPYVAAIHEPDRNGDQRNYHAHICFSTRPCDRIGDHQWAIAEEKVNGLTDKPGLRLVRALAAAHMNKACRAAGNATLFTHQNYAERGLDAERQAHVGPEAMAAHDRGEAVGVISRNAVIVERNEAAVARQQVERQLDATLHLQHLLEQAERAAQRRTVARAGRDAATALLRTATVIAQSVIRPLRPGNHLARALELRGRAVSVQRRLLIPARRAPIINPVAYLQHQSALLARRLIDTIRSAPLASTEVANLASRVGTLGAALAVSPIRAIAVAPARLEGASRIVALGTIVIKTLRARDTMLNSALGASADLRTIEEQLAKRGEADALKHEAAVRNIILNAAELNVTTDSGRLGADLAALTTADQDAFLALGANIQRTLLLERHAADQQRKRDDAERNRVAEQRRGRDADSARQHAARVDEACRILRESEGRPYSRNGRTLRLDLRSLATTERDLVTSIGIVDPSLRAALIARAKADARLDAVDAATSFSVAAPPPTADAVSVPVPAVSDGTVSPAPGSGEAADRIDTALAMLRARDDWVRQDGRGLYTFSDAALRAAGLTFMDVVTPTVQRGIEAIGFEQVDRLDPVVGDRSVDVPFIVDRHTIRLAPPFRGSLCDDVARWSEEPQFRAFVARVWPRLGIDQDRSPDQVKPDAGPSLPTGTMQRIVPADPWMQAAAIRRRAMADWDADERSDDVGMTRPGRTLHRPDPGAKDSGTMAEIEAKKPVRFHPGMVRGSGSIGG